MILGVGTDIIEIDRIREVFKNKDARIRDRVFTDSEWKYCFSMKQPFTHLAARFAAKEAYFKCLGSGVFALHEIEVVKQVTGKPGLELHGKTLEAWKEAGAPYLHISLSHNKLVANAVVVMEGKEINSHRR